MRRISYLIPALVVILVLALSSVFIVDERNKALVLQFGRVVAIKEEPGLSFKVPFIQNVVYYEDRILSSVIDPLEVTPLDDRRLVVDAFTRYRISDVNQFREAVGTGGELAAEGRLDGILRNELREVLGSVSSNDILSSDRALLMERILSGAIVKGRAIGIEVIDVRLKRTDLPRANLDATFARMRAEREREAADEIARQIKIRDLSGLIIIDFIDMLSYGNRRLVERRLKEKCRSDRARIQIGRISNFGLLEMSRQRLRESAIKWKVTLTDESFAQKLLKIVELKAVINKAKFVELKVCEKISDFLKENFVNDLTYFEKKNKMKIDIISDNSLIIPEYIIDIKNKSKKTIELIEYYEKLKNLETQNKEDKFSEKKENKKINKKKYNKKRYYKKTK